MPFSYHLSNLSLSALETMRLLAQIVITVTIEEQGRKQIDAITNQNED